MHGGIYSQLACKSYHLNFTFKREKENETQFRCLHTMRRVGWHVWREREREREREGGKEDKRFIAGERRESGERA